MERCIQRACVDNECVAIGLTVFTQVIAVYTLIMSRSPLHRPQALIAWFIALSSLALAAPKVQTEVEFDFANFAQKIEEGWEDDDAIFQLSNSLVRGQQAPLPDSFIADPKKLRPLLDIGWRMGLDALDRRSSHGLAASAEARAAAALLAKTRPYWEPKDQLHTLELLKEARSRNSVALYGSPANRVGSSLLLILARPYGDQVDLYRKLALGSQSEVAADATTVLAQWLALREDLAFTHKEVEPISEALWNVHLRDPSRVGFEFLLDYGLNESMFSNILGVLQDSRQPAERRQSMAKLLDDRLRKPKTWFQRNLKGQLTLPQTRVIQRALNGTAIQAVPSPTWAEQWDHILTEPERRRDDKIRELVDGLNAANGQASTDRQKYRELVLRMLQTRNVHRNEAATLYAVEAVSREFTDDPEAMATAASILPAINRKFRMKILRNLQSMDLEKLTDPEFHEAQTQFLAALDAMPKAKVGETVQLAARLRSRVDGDNGWSTDNTTPTKDCVPKYREVKQR